VNGQVHARSRNIADFFDIRLADLAPGRALTFNVYLYFPHNRHLILWMKEGDVPSAAYVEGCEAKGIERLWVRNEDRDAYLLSIAPEAGAQPEPPGPVPRTPESAIIASAMTSSDLGREEKKAIVAETSRRILAAIAAPKLASSQETANERARRIVQETLEQTTRLATGAVREIWRLSDVDPDLVHAANVATFAVVFAMAFGRIDAEVIADLALAGLLHDIGVFRVPAGVSAQPWASMSREARAAYGAHVEHGVEFLKRHYPGVSNRVLELIRQHHEKFDGTGYPKGLKGFGYDDLAQLLAMADLVESVASGAWDGRARSVRESFETLEAIEKAKTFPELFNPEVFSTVIRWTRSETPSGTDDRAVAAIREQAGTVARKKAG